MRLLIVLVVACGDGPGSTAIRGEPTLETFERRMCACRDATCAKQVVTEMAAWSQKVRVPRDNTGETAKIMARYNACLTAANKAR